MMYLHLTKILGKPTNVSIPFLRTQIDPNAVAGRVSELFAISYFCLHYASPLFHFVVPFSFFLSLFRNFYILVSNSLPRMHSFPFPSFYTGFFFSDNASCPRSVENTRPHSLVTEIREEETAGVPSTKHSTARRT